MDEDAQAPDYSDKGQAVKETPAVVAVARQEVENLVGKIDNAIINYQVMRRLHSLDPDPRYTGEIGFGRPLRVRLAALEAFREELSVEMQRTKNELRTQEVLQEMDPTRNYPEPGPMFAKSMPENSVVSDNLVGVGTATVSPAGVPIQTDTIQMIQKASAA